MPTINTDLLKRTMAAVELADYMGAWSQREWRSEKGCGTAYCFAGWVAQLERREWVGPQTIKTTPEEMAEGEDEQIHVGTWAAMRLGLTFKESNWLFSSNNDLENLRDIVDHLCITAEERHEQAARRLIDLGRKYANRH